MSAPARREVLRQGLEAAAEEMGEVLARAAFSPNIKERRDHSCAVFSPEGRLVAQAEHIPVHLGAMPRQITAMLETLGPLEAGEVALANDPHQGGTHLPDLTMLAPAIHEGTRVGYVAARAHHADVGGTSPGSMPATARQLEEEGIVIEPTLVRDASGWIDDVHDVLLAATRSPDERAGDLAAQHGVLVVGARRVAELAQREGPDGLAEGMRAIVEHTRRLLEARLPDEARGPFPAEAVLETGDGDAWLRVEATVEPDGLLLDYEGTDAQLAGNLNAPLPVTVAGAVYVARVLVGPEIPANVGLMNLIDVRVPEGTVPNPRLGAAVAGGNVETSQRNVDLLFDALADAFEGVPAASQGTMNNVTLGTPSPGGFTYYETLGGGEGATPTRAGRSGIHTHMTNTRNTPVEAFEHALPLRVRRLTLRRGTGGRGEHPGGDGLVREIEALVDDVEANLITTRRRTRPAGRQGGAEGAAGANRVERADGTIEALGPIATVRLDEGDVLVVETPGGGGWGTGPQA